MWWVNRRQLSWVIDPADRDREASQTCDALTIMVQRPKQGRFTANWGCQEVVMNSNTTIVALRKAGNSRGSPFWPSRICLQAVDNFPVWCGTGGRQ